MQTRSTGFLMGINHKGKLQIQEGIVVWKSIQGFYGQARVTFTEAP